MPSFIIFHLVGYRLHILRHGCRKTQFLLCNGMHKGQFFAMQNAASVAAIVLTTESLVSDIPNPQAEAAQAAAMAAAQGGGMY